MRFRDRRECGVALANAIAARFDAPRSNEVGDVSVPRTTASATVGSARARAPRR